MTKTRELVLDTDWLTTLIAVCGMLFLAVAIAFDAWRIVHGTWAAPEAPPLGRIFETLVCCYAILICVNFCLKGTGRLLKSAFGFLLVGMSLYVIRMWLPASSSLQLLLRTAESLIQLPAFVLLVIYGVEWFRSKVVRG